MATLNDYLEGVMRVPLDLLTSDGFSECPSSFSDGASVSDFKRFLNNCDQPITGIVSPQKLNAILEKLVVTPLEFQNTKRGREPLANPEFHIDCLIGQHCLDKAKQLLGKNHACIVRIYGIPPELPGRYSDGEICRQVLLSHRKQPSTAQRWLERLSRGKRKHVTMVCHREGIWNAMEDVAIFPGLWDDIKLGNWAKHLAAHIDEQIQTYWKHIFHVWSSQIFEGVDPGLRQHLDASSTRFLQFKSPAWSNRDQKAIRKRMNSGNLFCNISNEEARSRLLQNILGFKGVIPSILTFHENMRYLTLGAKILEKYIEVKRPTEKAGPSLAPAKTPESLFANLKQDWGKGAVRNHVEYSEGQYHQMSQLLDTRLAFIQLLLAALRWFPFLSSEAPLQDVKGLGMPAYTDNHHRRRLCKTARSLGFSNKMIEDGLGLPDPPAAREIPETLTLCAGPPSWRGGLPTISVFGELSTKSFLPNLNSAARQIDESEPNASLVQSDIVTAFFGSCNVTLTQHPEVEMDWTRDETRTFQAEESAPKRASITDLIRSISTKKRQRWDKGKGNLARPRGREKHQTGLHQNSHSDPLAASHAGVEKGANRKKVQVKSRKAARKGTTKQASPRNEPSLQQDTSDMDLDVPEPHQRMSAPIVDEYEVPSQHETQSNSTRDHEPSVQHENQQHLQKGRGDARGQDHEDSQQNQQAQSSDMVMDKNITYRFNRINPDESEESEGENVEIRMKRKDFPPGSDQKRQRLVMGDSDPEVPERPEPLLTEPGPEEEY